VSRLRYVLSGFMVVCFAQAGLCAVQPAPIHLREALRLTRDKVDVEDSSVQNAQLQLQMLEAFNRTRVEFRPQLSLLSLANPLFLAVNFGGFSINRRTAPSPVDLELARFSVVEAELGHARRRINAEIDTEREFFALAQSQDLAARTCKSWTTRDHDRDKVQTLVASNRITRLDLVRFEQDLTMLESDCVEGRAQVGTATLALMRLTGTDRPVEQVQIATDDLSDPFNTTGLPASAEVASAIFESRDEFKNIEEQISGLAAAAVKSGLHFDSFTASYTGFYIPLRSTSDVQAMNTVLKARYDRLRYELEDLKRCVRQEVEDNEQHATLAAARLRLARRKAQLADELRSITIQRVSAGLQGDADELWATRDAGRAEGESARLELEWKRSVFMVLALHDPENLQASALLPRSPRARALVVTTPNLATQAKATYKSE
jgi:hypothetical protein